MTQPEEATRPHSVSATISREIVQLHANLYGRGPNRARTFINSEFVLCALDDVFTQAETTLMEMEKEGLVRETRVAFQESKRQEFIAIVERATGRRVRAFHSQIDPKSNTVVEVFLLAPNGEDDSDSVRSQD